MLEYNLTDFQFVSEVAVYSGFNSDLYIGILPTRNENSKFAIINKKRITELPHKFEELQKIYSLISYPAVLPYIGYSTSFKGKKSFSLIAPFMEKGDLFSFILNKNPEKTPNTRYAIIIYGIVAGMKYLNDHNIIHGNLKPENILLDKNYYPKIADFTFSRYLPQGVKDDAYIPYRGGTPLYTPIESYSNKIISPDKIDVFSFAIIVYILFTKKHPFDGERDIYVIKKLIEDGYRPDTTDKIPERLAELIERCWNNDPDVRPCFDEILYEFDNYTTSYFDFDVDFDELNYYRNDVLGNNPHNNVHDDDMDVF